MGENSSALVAKSSADPMKVPLFVPLIRAVSSGDNPLFFEQEEKSTTESSVVAIHNIFFIIMIPAKITILQLPNCYD